MDHAQKITDFLKSISWNEAFKGTPEITIHTRSELGGETPLHVAAILGDEEAIRVLFEAGADINAVENYGCTPLHEAALQGHTGAYDILVSLGADITIKDNFGKTASDILIERGNRGQAE